MVIRLNTSFSKSEFWNTESRAATFDLNEYLTTNEKPLSSGIGNLRAMLYNRPEIRALILGFTFFSNDLYLLVEDALFSSLRVKLVDLDTHRTAVLEPLGVERATDLAHRPIGSRRVVEQDFSRPYRPDRTHIRFVTQPIYRSRQRDTLVRDRNAGRTETKLRPELQYLKDWMRESQRAFFTLMDIREDREACDSELLSINAIIDKVLTDPETKPYYQSLLRSAHEIDQLLELNETDPIDLDALYTLFDLEPGCGTAHLQHYHELLNRIEAAWLLQHGFQHTLVPPAESRLEEDWLWRKTEYRAIPRMRNRAPAQRRTAKFVRRIPRVEGN